MAAVCCCQETGYESVERFTMTRQTPLNPRRPVQFDRACEDTRKLLFQGTINVSIKGWVYVPELVVKISGRAQYNTIGDSLLSK